VVDQLESTAPLRSASIMRSGRKAVWAGADNGRGLHALTAFFARLACNCTP
jgi:hypothetical protein